MIPETNQQHKRIVKGFIDELKMYLGDEMQQMIQLPNEDDGNNKWYIEIRRRGGNFVVVVEWSLFNGYGITLIVDGSEKRYAYDHSAPADKYFQTRYRAVQYAKEMFERP